MHVTGNISNGAILHKYCPFHYCKEVDMAVNLNNPETQCAFEHSGIIFLVWCLPAWIESSYRKCSVPFLFKPLPCAPDTFCHCRSCTLHKVFRPYSVGARAAEQGGAIAPPKNCTVGLSSAHYVLPSAVCKSFSPPISYCFLRHCVGGNTKWTNLLC